MGHVGREGLVDMLEQARHTLWLEAQAILALAERLDYRFEQAVELLYGCQGRVVVTGMGKSGLIGSKIAATLSSTGTPAFFLHPAEASHGDIGMVTRRDVVLALSNSGETWEILALLPVIKRMGVPILSLVGRMASTLARESAVALDVSVTQEACPLGLAVALVDKHGFKAEQFAKLHPGGNLGKRLLLRVSDLMHTGERIPMVGEEDNFSVALLEMTSKRFGMTGVCNAQGVLVGIVTDGDVRRSLLAQEGINKMDHSVASIMTRAPQTIQVDALAVEAVHRMEGKKITSLFVMADETRLVGVIHLHDLLKAGLM
ncbi:MAG: KpsF/GutQ family sugar-phosphate isomerase [Magnetococcus sp. DMHC-6]